MQCNLQKLLEFDTIIYHLKKHTFLTQQADNIMKTSTFNHKSMDDTNKTRITYFSNCLKPIFHCKLGLRWLTKANEMSTNNMKSAWPTPAPSIGDPTPPIFHLLPLGGGGGSIRVGVTQILAFLDTIMLVFPMQNLWRWGSNPT